MAATFFCAAIGHETNTFAVTPTRMADFDFAGAPAVAASSERIRAYFRGTRTVHGGYLAAAEELGFELEPLLWAFATPSGVVERTAYEELAAVLLERLARRARESGCRGMLLDLHGAMVSEHLEDVEGDLIERTREVLGPDLPLVVTVDLHANVTERMATHADAIIGFEEYPHVDSFERGVQAGRLIHAAAAGTVRPRLAYVQLPLISMPPKQCTLIPPARDLLRRSRETARQPGVLDASIAYGFPFADIRDAGTSVLVTADGSAELAAQHAADLARAVWQRRRDFDPALTPVAEAIRYARVEATGLVVLADGSDNPGGGGPCDGTVVLRELLAAGVEDAVVAVIADPEVVAAAAAAGVGEPIEVRVGGKTDRRHGDPVALRAVVRLLSDGRFVTRSRMGAGGMTEMGRTAVLQSGGVRVVVTERRVQPFDAELLRSVGIEPREQRLVALKSAVHFRSTYQQIAERIFDLDTPGVHRPDFAAYRYRRLRPGVYPLDRNARFPGQRA
jgi:microcystin degradation protein MlrC